jgi:hypothetical protein
MLAPRLGGTLLNPPEFSFLTKWGGEAATRQNLELLSGNLCRQSSPGFLRFFFFFFDESRIIPAGYKL